jgi:hypothetical protein
MNMRNIYFLSVLQTIRIHIWINNRDSQLGSLFPIEIQIVPVEEIIEDRHHIGNGTRFMNAKYTLKVTEGVSNCIIIWIKKYLLFHGTDKARELAKNGSMHLKFYYGAEVSMFKPWFFCLCLRISLHGIRYLRQLIFVSTKRV